MKIYNPDDPVHTLHLLLRRLWKQMLATPQTLHGLCRLVITLAHLLSADLLAHVLAAVVETDAPTTTVIAPRLPAIVRASFPLRRRAEPGMSSAKTYRLRTKNESGHQLINEALLC